MNHTHTFPGIEFFGTVIWMLMIILINGCSTTPKIANMIPPRSEYGVQIQNTNKTIRIHNVLGGEEGDPMWEGSKINNASFREALIKTMIESNLFSEVISSDSSDYKLDVFLMSQSQPGMGINMTVNLLVRYTLHNLHDGSKIWEKDIPSKYTANLGEAFAGSVRVRKANEGAVRENLKLMIQEMANLNL